MKGVDLDRMKSVVLEKMNALRREIVGGYDGPRIVKPAKLELQVKEVVAYRSIRTGESDEVAIWVPVH